MYIQFQEREEKPNYQIHDQDGKFTRHFDEIFKAEGLYVQRLPKPSPNLNAFVERWIQSIKHEALNRFAAFGEDHLDHVVAEYVAHFHTERAHQRLGNRPPLKQEAPEPAESLDTVRLCAASGWAGC